VNSSWRKAISKMFSFHHLVIRSAVCLLVVLFALTAFAQSGRRGAKSPAVSVPTPEPIETAKKPPRDAPMISLLLGTNRGDVFAGIPLSIYDGVLQSCSGRLKESSAVSVEVATQEMTRSEAVHRAKNAKEGYVIWLNLRGEDQMGSNGGNLDGIFIEFVVFEAVTAKVRTQGTSYQGYSRKGGVVMGPNTGRSNNVIVESRLRVAAEDAAARILKALHIASASDIPPH
jgi:hypothetical protein